MLVVVVKERARHSTVSVHAPNRETQTVWPWFQYAPDEDRTALNVFHKISRSPTIDQFST